MGKIKSKNGSKPSDLESAVEQLESDFAKGDGFLVALAEGVGVLETLGLRYPVSSYESVVSKGLVRGSRVEDKAGYKKLFEQGVRSIVDLTLEKVDDPRAIAAAKMKFLNVPLLDNSAPKIEQMKAFLDFATGHPACYVHCEAGKGRTGVAVACYRMAVEKWPVKKATEEAKKFGLSLSNQLSFLEEFSVALKAGKVTGYRGS